MYIIVGKFATDRKFTTGVNDICGHVLPEIYADRSETDSNFATGLNQADGKFASGVNDSGVSDARGQQ